VVGSTLPPDAGSVPRDAAASDAGDASSVGDAGDAGVSPDGGDAGPADAGGDAADAAVDPPGICGATLNVGNGAALPSSTAADDFGLSVTADELSMAWVTGTAGQVTLHYADRAQKSDAFGATKTIGPSAAFAASRVALTPDGLGLAVVNADGLGFSLLSRAQRGDDFGAPTVGPFQLLNDQGANVLGPAGQRYADPLFASAAAYFVFSRFGGGLGTTVYAGTRIFATDPYSPGTPYAETALASTGGKRRIVTGASEDLRTLFVYDEAQSKSLAVSLGVTGAVTSTADLGPARDLQASGDCKAFYFTAGSPGDLRRSP
jgi:hypothetical protein